MLGARTGQRGTHFAEQFGQGVAELFVMDPFRGGLFFSERADQRSTSESAFFAISSPIVLNRSDQIACDFRDSVTGVEVQRIQTYLLRSQAIWSERLARLGELIAKNADSLVETLVARSLKEQTSADGSITNSSATPCPNCSAKWVAALASSGAEHGSAHRQIAFEHGEQRWQVGWKLTDVRSRLSDSAARDLEFLDTTLNEPLQTRECMAIGLALDEAIGLSVVSYVRNQEQQLRATQERMTEFLALLSARAARSARAQAAHFARSATQSLASNDATLASRST